jgi:carbon-monoxide dehydrogenase medium subunit
VKAAAFDYVAPASLDEAVRILASHRGEAKPLAGGQSLIPLMAFRLAKPKCLVDLRRIAGLDKISIAPDGVRLGARVRWCDIESSPALAAAQPLLTQAISHVAHYQVRNRGTVGGSLAHADPSSEMPAVAVTCDAEISVTGSSGTRHIKAADFFVGPLTTLLEPEEIIVEVRLPAWPAPRRWGFEEFARRRGDFAIAGIALFLDQETGGRAVNVHAAVFGACSRPHRIPQAEDFLNGRVVDDAAIAEVASIASLAVDPPDDLQGSAVYRRALVATLFERAMRRALARQAQEL